MKKKALTLIQLLTAIAVLSILLVMVAAVVNIAPEKEREMKEQNRWKVMEQRVKKHELEKKQKIQINTNAPSITNFSSLTTNVSTSR